MRQCGGNLGIGGTPAHIANGSNDGRVTYAGATYPCIAVICEKCGNTILINALVAGIESAVVPVVPGAEATNE